ncbi:hypothetical protein AQUSIP_20070 [Aquicella siphonis]|uniref:Uncharacterized protein n=1 Tax=Aquicella siphonis TaxID=254247 RepID=A0A5E4PJU7_9COXI|nr:TrbI/VirB10 family protein [Aquicella siphonis]VVC76683.1 hypothetical protein AQUSIP_20070 [Aquicella siphonis]
MAFDFSKLNFFKNLDARARVFMLFLAVIGLIFLVYLGTKYLTGGASTIGPSRVANAPAGMESVPGGVSPTASYQRAVAQANVQIAEAAKMTGASAIPTQINTGAGSFGQGSCIICSDKSANVKNLLDQWVREGKVSPDVADMLEDLASKNVSVDEYAAALDKLVKEGKLTPEQARALLEEYKKQHANALLGDSEKTMDDMIKSGELPLDVANQLLDAQKKGMSTTEYAALLQKLVREGKLSPAAAQRLLQQYSKQCLSEATNKHIVMIKQMQGSGTVTQDVGNKLIDLTKNNSPADVYGADMNNLVAQGKLTPAAAGTLLDAYRKGKAACGSAGTLNELLQQAENEAFQELSDLLAAGKISPETAAQLTSMIQNNVSMDEYKATVNQMVQDKRLTPQIGQLKIGDYEKVKQLRDAQQLLADLQANNATPEEYAEALKRLVAAGVITPEQAAQLLQEYQALASRTAAAQQAASGAFGALQQKVAGGAAVQPGAVEGEFEAAQTQAVQETAQERQARLDALTTAMTGQASQLIASWAPPSMMHREGTPESTTAKKEGEGAGSKESSATGGTGTASASSTGSSSDQFSGTPLIKGGTILFGVLDTAINSDYPDSPVLVTIVDGKYKGAKLLGKIVTTKGVSGQLDRVTLNFTLMNEDSWPKSKSITAYAIDPDTARTVLASSVDYHYMMRYGAMIATSFLQGYASSITNAGTSTTGIFGTSTTHPELSPSNKLLVGLGQVGQSLGTATQNYINRPPTVRVDSGVSLGILFMSDVT